MQITQEEIEQYVQQFIHQAIRYEADQVDGVRDLGDTYAQLREVVSTALLTDINVVFHLLGVGIREEAQNVQEYLDLIVRIEDYLPSLTKSPRPDKITEDLISKIEGALTSAQLGAGSDVYARMDREIDRASLLLASGLNFGEQISVPAAEARSQISSLVRDLKERHDLILQSTQGLVFGIETLRLSSLFSNIRDRVLGAMQSLLLDMRVERAPADETLSRQSARERFIQLQAAKVAIQQLTQEVNPETTRLQSGDILFSTTGVSAGPIESIGTTSGGFEFTADATVVVGVDGGAQETITLKQSNVPRLFTRAAPNPPASTTALYIGVELEDQSLGPWPADIKTPAYTKHGDLEVAGATSAFVGFTCGLKYVGTVTAANQDAVRAIEGLLYKVIGYDNRSAFATPVVKLDPPLPTGTAPAPLADWELTLLPQLVRWEVPTAVGGFPTYLDRLVQQISGPTDASNRDAFQPWRIHTQITPTAEVGQFLPGERVYNTNGTAGEKEGVVIYHDSSGLYIHEMANPFAPGDDLAGRESLATMTNLVTVDTSGVAELTSNSGQVNSARYVSAEAANSLLVVGGRSVFSGTGLASIAGTTLTLAGGQRGLWQAGLWNGDTVTVDGTDYVIDTITSDLTATLTTSATVTNQAWSAAPAKAVRRLDLTDFGERLVSFLYVPPSTGYEASPFTDWTYFRTDLETTQPEELEFNIPQSDTAATYSADEVAALIQISGLTAESVRETLYRHPDEAAQATMTVASNVVEVPSGLPSDDTTPDLAGHYFIPEEGEHADREFLILLDTPGSPRQLTIDALATVTETVPSYRIEARRVRLATETTSPTGQLSLGAGTAHSALGLPSDTNVYGQFNTGVFRQGAEEVDLEDFGIIVGDDIQSLTGEFLEVEIDTLDTGSVTFTPTIAGNVQNHRIRIEGVCATQWNELVLRLSDAVEEWFAAGKETLDDIDAKLAPIAGLASSSQPSDVADFRREISELKTVMVRLLAALRGFQIPDIPAGREILESLNENGLDRARFLLTRGRYDEFFSMRSEEGTTSGRVQNILGQVNLSLGTSNIQGDLEADADEPITVVDGLEDVDDREGIALGDQFLDDDDTFSVEDEEFSNG